MNNNATRPRPIQQPGREIRSMPDDNEPSYSYEEKSFLAAGKEQDVEDEFHRRLHGSRHSGGSFWRTACNSNSNSTSTSSGVGEPAFSSMNMRRNESAVVDRQKSTGGRLGGDDHAVEVSLFNSSQCQAWFRICLFVCLFVMQHF